MCINKNRVEFFKTDWRSFTKKKKENEDILEISDLRFQVCIENDVNIQ